MPVVGLASQRVANQLEVDHGADGLAMRPSTPGSVNESLVLAGRLAALLMCLGRMLVSGTRVFMRLGGMLLGSGVIAFVMVFSGGMVRFRCRLVGFRCFFVVGAGHVGFLCVDPRIDPVVHSRWRSQAAGSNEIVAIHFDRPLFIQKLLYEYCWSLITICAGIAAA